MSDRNVSSNGVETNPRFDRKRQSRMTPPSATGGRLHLGWRTLSTPVRGRRAISQMNGNGKLSQRPNGLADNISNDHLDHGDRRFDLHFGVPRVAVHAPVIVLK